MKTNVSLTIRLWLAFLFVPFCTLMAQQEKVYENGDRYVGQLRNGMRHGKGTLFCADSTVYEGVWKNDRKNGKGRITFSNKNVYEGEFKDGVMEGKGTLYFHDKGREGRVYKGEMKANKILGKGIMTYPDGQSYEGEWSDGLREGHGVYKDGTTIYDCTWHNGRMDGYGEVTYVAGKFAGSTYKGGFKNNMFNGQGTYVRNNGYTYTGNFINQERTGMGKSFNPETGVEYEGEFYDGKPQGAGIMYYRGEVNKGCHYEGEFREGVFHGYGTYFIANGTKYEGKWVKDHPEGEFKMTKTDGTVVIQHYKEGKLVSTSGTSSADDTLDFTPQATLD